jgi:endonuclease/exonuclease/phosphatase (EEP) superfamily protein YafD
MSIPIPSFKTVFSVVVQTLAFCVMVVSALSLLGSLSPLIDIFSHFRWQYALLTFLFTVLLVMMKCRTMSCVVGVGTIINVNCLCFLWIPAQTEKVPDSAPELTILNMNPNFGNNNFAATDKMIAQFDPDVVTLEELTPLMQLHLMKSMSKYPYCVAFPRTDPFGIAIFSKHKLTNVDENPLQLPLSFVLHGDITIDKKVVSILAIHAAGPTSGVGCTIDKNIADNLVKFKASEKNRSIVLIGDMNCTPWSVVFRRILHAGRFIDSERGFGLQCSWPTDQPLLAIPIDHCFFTSDWSCVTRTIGTSVGSDHSPLFVRLKRLEVSAK